MLRKIATLAALLGATAAAHAQYAVDQRVNTQIQHTGNLFDASPSLTGGRINVGVRPVSPMIGGNAFASGNVGRGMSLHSRTNISDPSAFGAPLGSGSLYEFRRDSVSAFDALRPAGDFVQPYYDPSTTAFTSGMLQGYGAGATRTTWGGGPVAPTSIARLPGGAPLSMRPTTLYQSDGPYGPARPPAAYSSIFGPPSATPPPAPRVPIPTVADLDEITQRTLRVGQPQQDATAAFYGQRQLGATSSTLATPLTSVLSGDSRAQLGPIAAGSPAWATPAEPLRPGLIIPERLDTSTPAAIGVPAAAPARVTDPSVLPGYDVFTDMRLALALEKTPGAEWFAEMQRVAQSVPELSPSPTESAGVDAQAFLQSMLTARIKSLTGRGASATNDLMLKAESLLAIGNYTEAADRYQTAHVMDPTNPLPLIGRGHALLAAGEYRSSAGALIAGLERFPELARFSFDLTTLLGGAENVDIRRADLMRRLAERETPELRFLLGYIEYQAGDKARGLADLEKAAELDRGATLISKYPALLKREAAPPPPKIVIPPAEPQPAPADQTP